MKLINYSESDVSLELATRAHSGVSMSPERRGQQTIHEYMQIMQNLDTEFNQWVTAENQDSMIQDLERYRIGYVNRLSKYLASKAGIVSQFITGAGGWTSAMVRRNEKRNESCDNKRNDLLDYSTKVIARLRRKYNPMLALKTIHSNDEDAIERLQKKIDALEKVQEMMKDANKIIRSNKLTDDEKRTAVLSLGFKPATVDAIFMPNYMGKIGFESFQLSNNNAEIRRLKARIESIQKEMATRQSIPHEYTINGIRVVEAPDYFGRGPRLQIYFWCAPLLEVRNRLRKSGFVYTKTLGCWQRVLNDNARYAAKTILESTTIEYERYCYVDKTENTDDAQ